MRKFRDGDEIVIEPFRAASFPVVKDLMVDRRAFDRIIESGGFISAPTGTGPGRQRDPGPQGRGRLRHGRGGLHRLRGVRGCLPQLGGPAVHRGQARPSERAAPGPARAVAAGRGHGGDDGVVLRSCTNHGECTEACPKEISLDFIAFMNRDYVKAKIKNRKLTGQG